MTEKGKLFVISAPSGAGKSTLIKAMLKSGRIPDCAYAVSHTSRVPRPGEIDGKDYHFVSREEFEKMIANGDFIEWTESFGNCYGTDKNLIMNQLDAGHNVLTDIDVVGAKNIKKLIPSAILIFVAPPSFKVLKQRLTQRKTDSEEEAETRLDRAKSELAEMGLYDFIIINDDFSKALDSLIDIVNLGVGPKKVDKEKLWEDFFLDEDS